MLGKRPYLGGAGLLVAGDFGVDGPRPGVYAASEGLGVGKSLVAKPEGDI
jgi:hypothetical protein